MTKMIYDVLARPKTNLKGRTNVGWEAECGRDAVNVGGYLITTRTKKDEVRRYQAVLIKDGVAPRLGDFDTRAKGAFAIWRAYNTDWRENRNHDRTMIEAEKENRRRTRTINKAYRNTPEGKEVHRLELNQKAQVRRDNMSSEEKTEMYAKRVQSRRRAASASVA